VLSAVLSSCITFGSAIAAEKPAAKPPDKPAEKPNPIHPEADRILRETSSKLAAAKALSLKAEVWEDVLVSNHKVTTSKTVDVRLRRPDRVQVEVRSPRRSRGFWYDGKSLTLLDRAKNLYGSVVAPGTIDQVIDAANDKYGINFPLEDFLVNDPYASAKAAAKGVAYFGKVKVLGTPCQHIAFSTAAVDGQLWVSEETKLPRKYVITYKNEAAAPQVTVVFDNWDLNSRITDETFVFNPPKGAGKIEVFPSEAANILQPTGKN